MTLADTSWHDRGACRDHDDPGLWFPEGRPSNEAKAICAGCPVRRECREAGLHEPAGIWGGLAERERRAEVRRRDLARQRGMTGAVA